MPKLLHHAQGVEVRPAFHYLAIRDPLYSNARYLHLLACRGPKGLRLALVGTASPKADYNLIPFSYHILYSVLKIGKGVAVGGGELPGPFYASCLSTGRLVADVVRVDNLVYGVKVARMVEEFLHLAADNGLILFGHILFSLLQLYCWVSLYAGHDAIRRSLPHL